MVQELPRALPATHLPSKPGQIPTGITGPGLDWDFWEWEEGRAPSALLGTSWDSWQAKSGWKPHRGQEFPGGWMGFYSLSSFLGVPWCGGTWGHGGTGGRGTSGWEWIPQAKAGFGDLGVFPNLSDPAVLSLLPNPKGVPGDPGSCAKGSQKAMAPSKTPPWYPGLSNSRIFTRSRPWSLLRAAGARSWRKSGSTGAAPAPLGSLKGLHVRDSHKRSP